MTSEEIALKFQLRKDTASVVYHGHKVDYFVEDNEEQYDLYFLVTDPTFDEKCDKEKLHNGFGKMKQYLYDEGFLDPMVKDTDSDKHWKIHFLVQYQTSDRPIIKSADAREKPLIVLRTVAITLTIVTIVYWIFKLFFI
jgi:hypothetical protein